MRSRSAKPILFAMLAAVLSAAAWIAFIGPLDRILVAFSRERIEHALAAYVQPWKLSVSYHSASPSFALGLSMRDLRISTPGGSSLYLRRVRLGLDIVRSLVSGQLVWTDGVLLEGVQARLNLDGDRELLTTILRALQEPGTDSAPSLGKLGAVLRGASLELVSDSLPALSIDIRRASMDAGDDKSIAFSVAGTLRANDPDWRFGFGSALVPLSVLGKLDADGTLALSGTLMADTALGSLSEVRMSASLSDSLGQLSLDAGKTLESLRLSYDRDSGLARMEGSFKDFVPL
ncbi:MAG TPA: hypothetical protein PLC54_06230, partial [Spirochaetales bacterium]|nr:hypothetical protein [Spirochaetales bacterium]